MNNFTPAQIKSLQGWTEQRDALLRDIGALKPELDETKKALTAGGLALADLHKSTAEAQGRLSVLEALEQRVRDSLPNDIAELQVRKNRLENECAVMDEKIKGGEEKYHIITVANDGLHAAHETMKDQAAIVGRVVGEVIQVSEKHTSEMKNIMVEVHSIADQVIEKGNKNIETSNILIPKLTELVVKQQVPLRVRRVYAAGHPKAETEQTSQ